MNNSTKFAKVAVLLTGSMLVAGVGTLLGAPIHTLSGIIITALLMLGSAIAVGVFARSAPAPVAVALLGALTFFTGLCIGPAIAMYVQVLGGNVVLATFFGTAGIMALCGLIATFSGINFAPLERFLMIGLFGLILVGLIVMFTGMSFAFNLVYCLAGIAIFVGFFLVDFFRLATSADDTWGGAVEITAQLFLDFANLFLRLLELIALLSGKKNND